MILALFWFVVIAAFIFGLTNGFLDGGSLLSTVISTRAMEPLPALLCVAGAELAGLFLFGTAVAHTLGRRLVMIPGGAHSVVVLTVLLASIVAALSWNLFMWRMAWPSSSSHALVGGLIGASVASWGWSSLQTSVLAHVILFLMLVPLIALVISGLLSKAAYAIGQYMHPSVTPWLAGAQIVVLCSMALVHGSNDGQKTLALLMMAAGAARSSPGALGFSTWMLWLCSGALSLGVILGSHRTLTTLGRRFFRVHRLQSLCAQSSAFSLIVISTWAGYPISTGHVLSSAVVGAGAAVRPNSVRWMVVRDMVVGWLVTIPASAVLAGTLVRIFNEVHHVVS